MSRRFDPGDRARDAARPRRRRRGASPGRACRHEREPRRSVAGRRAYLTSSVHSAIGDHVDQGAQERADSGGSRPCAGHQRRAERRGSVKPPPPTTAPIRPSTATPAAEPAGNQAQSSPDDQRLVELDQALRLVADQIGDDLVRLPDLVRRSLRWFAGRVAASGTPAGAAGVGKAIATRGLLPGGFVLEVLGDVDLDRVARSRCSAVRLASRLVERASCFRQTSSL